MGGGGIVNQERGGWGRVAYSPPGADSAPARSPWLGRGGAGGGEGESLGGSSSRLQRRPRLCPGGAGPRRAHPRASTRRARVLSEQAQAQAQGEASWGAGGKRRLASGARGGIFRGGDSGTEGRRGWGRPAPNSLLSPLSFPAVWEAHFPGWVSRGRRGLKIGALGHRGCGRGAEGRTRAWTLLPPTPEGGAELPGLLRPALGRRSPASQEFGLAARAGAQALARCPQPSLWRGTSLRVCLLL